MYNSRISHNLIDAWNSTGSLKLTTNPVSTTTMFTTDEMAETVLSSDNTQGTTATAVGVSIALLIILSMILMIVIITIVLIRSRRQRRRSTKQNLYIDNPYRREVERQIQHQFNDPTGLYDEIHFCPSTGQIEFNLKGEIANMNNPNDAPHDSLAGNDSVQHSSTLNTAPNHEVQESTEKQPVYAVVDKTRKKNRKKAEDQQSKEAKTESLVYSYGYETSPHTVEYLYTAIKKQPKGCEPKGEEETPPIPPHTVEELYTAILKMPKGNAAAIPPQYIQN